MGKINEKKLALLMADINKEFGEGSIYTLEEDKKELNIPRVSTGLPDLDEAIGGGIPEGRVMEVFGLNMAGKTSLAYHLTSRYPKAMFIDMEWTFDKDLAMVYGTDPANLIVSHPEWAEEAMDEIIKFAEVGIPFIVIDSVASMISRKEAESKDSEKQQGMAELPRLLSRRLPKLCAVCHETGTTVMFINQMRDNFKAMLFGDPYTTPGGHALKHYASLRIKMARKQWYKNEKLGNYGQLSKIQVVKSKICQPFREAELPIIFDRGFVAHEQVNAIEDELLVAAGKRPKKRRIVSDEGADAET